MSSFDDRTGSDQLAPVLSFPGVESPSPLALTSDGHSFDGPLSKAMWEKVSSLKSRYPDTFDWSVYDRLYNKFGATQPRGGVVFKTTLKLVNYHPTCNQCHHAFELDTYGRGCVHNCSYCYAKDQLTLHGFWNQPHPMPVDLSEIRKIFHTVFETDKRSKWREILDQRIPLRIGSMSDSFMWMDKKYGVTKEVLKILKFYQYPHIIFTRSDLIAEDEYLSELDRNQVSVQFSMSSIHEALTRTIEPGAPSPRKRLAALKKVAEAGIWTTVRINPLFPTYPDGYFSDRRSIEERFGSMENAPKLDFFDISQVDEFVDALKEAKVPSLLAGFVRLSPIAINRMSAITGVDFRSFFKPEVLKGHGDKHYSDPEIAYYYKKIQASAAKRGIRFSTCYIGNGEKDFYQYQSMWSNKGDCCDARGVVPAFRKTSQDVSWEIRKQHSPHKELADSSKQQQDEMRVQYADVIAESKKALEVAPGLRVVLPEAAPKSPGLELG